MARIRGICFVLVWKNWVFDYCIQKLLCTLYDICRKMRLFFYQKSKKKLKKFKKTLAFSVFFLYNTNCCDIEC